MAQDTRSLWEKTVQLPRRAALEGHVNTQVAIIGAGLTGSLLGYRLTQLGVDCVLLEAGGGSNGENIRMGWNRGLSGDCDQIQRLSGRAVHHSYHCDCVRICESGH